MKTTKKILAMLLAIATLIGVFSCATTVFAEEYNEYADNKAYQEALLTEAVETEEAVSEIVCEIPEKRDEYSKTYKRADGSFTSVVSQYPIHKLKNGEWEDIDNTLKTEDNAITNADGAFDIEFPETISENEKITVNNNGESLAFSIDGIENAEGIVEENKTTQTDLIKKDLEKSISQITYENINENTNLQYIVSSNYVKENIIVSNKESLKEKYSFNIEKGELSAELDEENNLTFKNQKNEIVFTIPAPVMKDSANAVSYEIEVQIENADESVLTLSYTPSKEWLENESRVYPVIIDPVIIMESNQGAVIEDTYIGYYSENPNGVNLTGENAQMGIIADKTVVDGDSSYTIKSEVLARINMEVFNGFKQPGLTVTGVNFAADGLVQDGNLILKAIEGDWECDEITHSDIYPEGETAPAISFDEKITDYYAGSDSATAEPTLQKVFFNITELFNQWLKGERNNDGFAILPQGDAMGYLYLDGFTENTVTGKKTYSSNGIIIDYVDTNSANDSFEYLTQEIGRAGTGAVNTFGRNVSLSRFDSGMDGLRMPVSIGFNYNTSFGNFYEIVQKAFEAVHGSYPGIPHIFGKNWFPSYLYNIVQITENQMQVFTGEGTLVTFNMKEEIDSETQEASMVFEAEEASDSGYELEVINQENDIYYENVKLILPTGEAVYFNDGGFATEIQEAEPNPDGSYDKITIAYEEGSLFTIDYITDGIGRKYDFIYNSQSGLLSEIKCLAADGATIKAGTTNTDLKVIYGYNSNGYLTSVTYPDGEAVSYTYDSNGNLVKAQNIDGYNIQYTYDSLGKITNIAEYAGNTPGNTIQLTQLSNRQVKVVDGYNGTETYQFGRDGKLHYTFDEKGNYYKSDYAPAKDENVYSSSDWRITSENLLKNGSFEETSSAKALDWSNSFNVEDINSSELITDYACRVSSVEQTNALQSQRIAVDGDKSYTFSLYAKSNLSALTDADRLYMRITAEDEDGNETSKSRQIIPTEDFEQYSITISTETEISAVTVEFGLKNKTGDFYINNAQLEKGYGTAPFNYIKNGSFNNSGGNWSTATIVDENLNSAPIKAVKLSGGLPQYTVRYELDSTTEYQETVRYGLDSTTEDEETVRYGLARTTEDEETVRYGLARTAEEGIDETSFEDHISAITQNVEINGKKGDTFTVGGWFKGQFDDNYINSVLLTIDDSIPQQLASSSAQIKVTYSYTDTVTTTDETTNETTTTEQTLTENFVVDFCPNNNSWQYAADTFALKGDAEFVDVTILAKNIPENCFVTGVELTLDKKTSLLTEEEELESDLDEESNISLVEDTSAVEEICLCEDCEEVNCTCRCANEVLCNCVQCKRGTIKEYDNYGNVVSTVKTDGVSTMETETIYSTDGNSLAGAKDENEVVSTFTESPVKDTALPLQVSVAGRTADYTFNSGTHLETVNKTVSGLSLGNQMQVAYSYDNDKITKVTHNGYSYNFEYDKWGNIATEKVGNQVIANYYYGADQYSKQLDHILYENGQFIWYDYDYSGNVSGIKYSNDIDWRFTLDYSNSEKTTITDTVQNYLKEITEKGFIVTDLTTNQIIYSKTDLTENFNGAEYTKTINDEVYEQADGTTLQSYVISGIANLTKTLGFSKLADWFGRDKKKTVSVNGSALSLEKEFKYKNGLEQNSTTKYIEEISNSIKINDVVNSAQTLKYTYDIHGNVKTVSSCVNDVTTLQYEYFYDEANQIVRVDDYINNLTTTYQYDMGGNIVSAKEFERTNYSAESVAINEDVYVYDTAWKDKVSSVNGNGMTYDVIGNLLTYDGKTHTWIAGRKLSTFQNADYSLSFTYDENGLRSSKTVNHNGTTKTIKYIWVDGKLIGQMDGTDALRFIYNDSEEIVGLIKNDSEIYLYIKNIFGDIIGIVDENGSVVVEYEYDIWGEILSVSGSLAETLGQLNPIRYRGYYYDSESGYYYLQSRYYDPELRRFINADKLEGLHSPKNTYLYADSVNTFAYCANSPVNMVDYSGEKEKNNTSNYLANVLVFALLLVSYRDEVVKIASDQILYNIKKASTWIYNKSQKGCICILLSQKISKKVTFSDFMYKYYLIIGDKVFDALSTLALEKFKEFFPKAHADYYIKTPTINRPLIFSDKCVKNEIKDHCLGYWYSIGKIKNQTSIRKFMKAYKIVNKNGLEDRCKNIDIVEQDVCDPVDRVLFDYFNGIRDVYKNTLADPYWRESNKRVKNNVRNNWKKVMIPTNRLGE